MAGTVVAALPMLIATAFAAAVAALVTLAVFAALVSLVTSTVVTAGTVRIFTFGIITVSHFLLLQKYPHKVLSIYPAPV